MQNAQGSIDLNRTFQPSLDVPIEISSEFNAVTPNGVQITLLNVEDSRCPANVLCVWQGEAKVSINIIQNEVGENLALSTTQDKSFQIFNGLVIKLVDVQPYPYSNKEIPQTDYVVTLVVSDTTNLSPLQQFKSGIGLDKIKCKPSYELVMKKTNGNPACLKPETIPKLIEWGWAVHVLWPEDKDKPQNSDMFENDPLQITTEEITYFENATGFLARPTEDRAYPGVILIHEWWGLNDNIKEMARALASQGYVVLAVDLYASQAATTPDGARQLVTTFDSQKGIINIKSATEFLKSQGAQKIATVGWCFGGTQSMNYALSGNKLDATVIYYGQPVTDEAQLSKISWPVLGIFGELDSGIPVEKVNDFRSSLNNLGIQNEIFIYPGIGHAFANPSGANYAPNETKDAWQKTVSFLDKHLK